MGTLTHLILRHLSGESSQVSRGTLTRLSLGHLSEQPYRSVWGTLSHPNAHSYMRKAVLGDSHEGRSQRQGDLCHNQGLPQKPRCPGMSYALPSIHKVPFSILVPWQSWLCLGAVRITLPPAHQSPLQKVQHQSGGRLKVTVLNQALLYGNECSAPLGTWK